jgi:hypothetical protein
MTQQEINEAAEEYEYTDGIYGFKAGVKWQQQRSYSEEDMREAYKWGRIYDMLEFDDWLETKKINYE